MDRPLVENKLESLRRCIRRIETKCPDQAGTLTGDYDVQDILTLNLTRAVQLCVDIAMHVVASSEESPPDTMAASFGALRRLDVLSPALARRIQSAIGFRNVAIHNYREIDWRIVHAICHEHVEDFRSFAQAVHRAMPARG
jgi:uncharacterized protein YutE (UPF0331/DUF86 family)